MLTLLGLAACRGGGGPTDGAGETLAVEAAPPPTGFQVIAEDLQTTGTRLQLRWQGAPPHPSEELAPLGLCLPLGEAVTAHWRQATLNGKPVAIHKSADLTTASQTAQTLPEEAGIVEYVGLLRHWPIYSFKPGREIFDLFLLGAGDGPLRLELTLDLRWNRPAAAKAAKSIPATKAEESWLRVARALVANPDALTRFQVAAPAPVRDGGEKITDPRRLAPGSRPWARLEITTAGLSRLDPDELLKAGFPSARLKPEALRVYSHGQAVPIMLAPGPGAPPVMKPGVYFYAQGGAGEYSSTRTYWVTLGEDLPARRMEPPAAAQSETTNTLAAIPRTVLRNADQLFQIRQGNFMAIEGMDWVEAPLALNVPMHVTIDLPDAIPGNTPLRAGIDFFINRDDSLSPFKIEAVSDHEGLGNFTFFNATDGHKEFQIPAHCVKDGRVTISLRLYPDESAPAPEAGVSGFWFDRLSVTYAATPHIVGGRLGIDDTVTTQPFWLPLADLATSTSPPLLAMHIGAGGNLKGLAPILRNPQGQPGLRGRLDSGERIEVEDVRAARDVPSPDPVVFDDLTAAEQGADILLITHRQFMDQAALLKKQHEDEGWKVRLVDIQSVYDTFSDGELSPLAIKAFLVYALRHWQGGAPGQVLLLGDCTSDYVNATRNEVRNWVPTYTYNRGGESWASDTWFTTIAGEDNLGDLMVGRLSVANDRDAAAVVKKAIDYATQPKAGPWRARLAFVSDDGEFPEVVEVLRRQDTPPAYAVSRVYLNELPLEDNWYLPRDYVERKNLKVSRAATDRILDIFRKGTTFLTYYGHGSPNIWTDERIWFGGNSLNSDNLHTSGTGFCTFVANMTCNSGAIDYPLTPWNICITEDMMRIPDGGAIACFVPSGPGVTSMHREMSKALHHALFDQGLRRFGEVTALAKARYALAGNPGAEDLIFMYHLLGDPALELQLAGRRGRFEPRPAAVVPGAAPQWTLTGIEPAAGQWVGELVGDNGTALWTGESASYREGRIALQVPIPAEAPAGNATLRIYAWNPESGADLALAGPLTLQRPQLTLDRVVVTTASQAEVEINNPGLVEARGELEIRMQDAQTSRVLMREPIALNGGGRRVFIIGVPAAASLSQPAMLEAGLSLPAPPDDPTQPQCVRKRLVLGVPPGWLGWIEPLCVREERAAESAVVRVWAAVPPGSGEWMAVLRTADEQMLTTQSLQVELEPQPLDTPLTAGVRVAAFVLDRAQVNKVERGGTILLRPLASKSATEAVRPVLGFEKIARRRAALRFEPGSLKIHPTHPTDGETVFIDLAVRNEGNMTADPAIVELLTRPPNQGNEPATDLMQNGPKQLPGLAPGRRLPVTLRWDPTENSGDHTVWLHLRLATGTEAGTDQTTSVIVQARTKARLTVGRVDVEATPQDLAQRRIKLKAEVKNDGQTDARNVMVSFYRTPLLTPENKLGEMELRRVTGGETAEAVFVWNFDPARDMVRGTELPQPTVQVWLKGSTQRISNADAIP